MLRWRGLWVFVLVFLYELGSLIGELAVVVDSHGVVVHLPWEALFGVGVDACSKRRLWEVDLVHCDRLGGGFGRLGGDELVQRARDGREAKLLDNVRHDGPEKWLKLLGVKLVARCQSNAEGRREGTKVARSKVGSVVFVK